MPSPTKLAPEELVSDRLFESVWKKSSLGAPILGSPDTLMSITHGLLKEYTESHYCSDNTVISICGGYDRGGLIKNIEKKFRRLKPSAFSAVTESVEYIPSVITKQKDIEQNHLCLGLPSAPLGDDLNYALSAISNAFGNGMSSRLFQALREWTVSVRKQSKIKQRQPTKVMYKSGRVMRPLLLISYSFLIFIDKNN